MGSKLFNKWQKNLLFWLRLFSSASPVQSQQKATASPHKGNPSAPLAGVAQPHGINVLGTKSPHVSAQVFDALSLPPVINVNIAQYLSSQYNLAGIHCRVLL